MMVADNVDYTCVLSIKSIGLLILCNVILIRVDASDDNMKSVKSASRYFMPVYIMYRYAKSNSVLTVDHVHVLYPKAGRPRLLTVLKMMRECEAFYYLCVLTLITSP